MRFATWKEVGIILSSIPGHSVELSVNPNVFEFPGTGEHRLLSAWVDMFPSPEVKYKDKNNKVVTKLKNTKGAKLGSAVRLNVVPTSVHSAAVQLQIFPRSLEELKVNSLVNSLKLTEMFQRLAAEQKIDPNSPQVPALTFNVENKQALKVRNWSKGESTLKPYLFQCKLVPQEKSQNLNTWPLVFYQGPGELSIYPTVEMMDMEVSAILRTATSVLNHGSSNKAVLELLNGGLQWPTFNEDDQMPKYREALQVEDGTGLDINDDEGEYALMDPKYHPKYDLVTRHTTYTQYV